MSWPLHRDANTESGKNLRKASEASSPAETKWAEEEAVALLREVNDHSSQSLTPHRG